METASAVSSRLLEYNCVPAMSLLLFVLKAYFTRAVLTGVLVQAFIFHRAFICDAYENISIVCLILDYVLFT